MTTAVRLVAVAACLAFAAPMAQAHVEDTDSVDLLPPGTVLRVLWNLNIKPKQTELLLVNGVAVSGQAPPIAPWLPYCRILHLKSDDDRVLEAGTPLSLGRNTIDAGTDAWTVIFQVTNQSEIVFFQCFNARNGGWKPLTVGELKQTIAGVLSLEPPAPRKISSRQPERLALPVKVVPAAWAW